MPTREQVLDLLEAGLDYEAAARRLRVPAGQLYLTATGLPADGGDTPAASAPRRPGALPPPTQHLANPPVENPTGAEAVHRWLTERAAADRAMRYAAARWTPALGPGPDSGGPRDVTAVLTRDHDRITALVKQLNALPGHRTGGSAAQLARRRSVVDLIRGALAAHEPAEREHLWPAVRRKLDDGKALAEQALRREHETAETLAVLGRTPADTDEFDDLVERLADLLRKHVAFEDAVFAKLRDALGEKARDKLGKKVRRALKAAPARATRSHQSGS